MQFAAREGMMEFEAEVAEALRMGRSGVPDVKSARSGHILSVKLSQGLLAYCSGIE